MMEMRSFTKECTLSYQPAYRTRFVKMQTENKMQTADLLRILYDFLFPLLRAKCSGLPEIYGSG